MPSRYSCLADGLHRIPNGRISRATNGVRPSVIQSHSTAKNLQESDSALMMSFAAGDLEGFELLFRRHSGSIYRFFYFGTHGDKPLAAELFHDVWMTVVRGRTRYTNDINFTDWLYHSAWARLHDHLRLHALDRDPDGLKVMAKESSVVSMADYVAGVNRSDANHEAGDMIVDLPVVDPAVDNEENSVLIDTLRHMSLEHKEVVLLRYCFSMSLQDIADFIDVRKTTVERISREAASLLRQKVEVQPAESDQFNG